MQSVRRGNMPLFVRLWTQSNPEKEYMCKESKRLNKSKVYIYQDNSKKP